MNVCLFGGSFDPPHKKHVEIVEDLLKKYDEVWVIVSKSSPFKNNHFESFNNRFEMAKLAFNRPFTRVLDLENSHNFKYTYDTVKFLCDSYSHKFSFAIGSDNYNTLESWYQVEELKKLVDFEVFKRTNISSTVARVTLDCEIENVNLYIQTNRLYGEFSVYSEDLNKLKNVVSNKRYIHSIYVFATILKIAKSNNLDPHKCAMAAIYHDYYKDIATDGFIESFVKDYPKYKDIPKHVMHGIIASHKLELDGDVLDAIKYHSTGKEKPSKILMALFISDYCEPSRFFHNEVIDILLLSYTNLECAYYECLKSSNKRVLKLHKDLCTID